MAQWTVDKKKAVQKIADDPVARAILYLVSKGVPFEVAEALDADELDAWRIIFGEIDGGTWSWTELDWTKDT